MIARRANWIRNNEQTPVVVYTSVCRLPAPVFYFGEVKYHVDESDGHVEVKVWRTGSDLSKAASVTVRSRKAEPVSAEGERPLHSHALASLRFPRIFITFLLFSNTAGTDYVGISRNLDFAPGVSMQTFKVTILDDLGQPELEGAESFELVLRMPVNGILGEPGKAAVFINDSVSDRECFSLSLLKILPHRYLSLAAFAKKKKKEKQTTTNAQ